VISTRREAAHPPECARCGAGADCSAIKHQSLRLRASNLLAGVGKLAPSFSYIYIYIYIYIYVFIIIIYVYIYIIIYIHIQIQYIYIYAPSFSALEHRCSCSLEHRYRCSPLRASVGATCWSESAQLSRRKAGPLKSSCTYRCSPLLHLWLCRLGQPQQRYMYIDIDIDIDICIDR
jgi:hypothetical protein